MLFRKIIICIFILTIPSTCFAAGELITFLKTGNVNERLNWIIVAEGFTLEQKVSFKNKALRVMQGILNEAPWSSYKDLINVFGVFVPSAESGADKRCGEVNESKNTAFDAVYELVNGDEDGGCRFLTVNYGKVFSEVIPLALYYDNIFVMVNDEQYGGSGGEVVTFSSGSNTIELALHELGHVIADLADEYTTPYDGYRPGDSEPNVTFKTERDEIPWNMWIKPGTNIPTYLAQSKFIGLFKGARYLSEGIYRPRHTCKMRTLGADFCEICKEAQVLSIYQYLKTISGTLENFLYISGGQETFSTNVTGEANRYKITWLLDGELLPESSESIQIDTSTLPNDKDHILKAVVEDSTNMVRTNRDRLVFEKEWTLIYKESTTNQIDIADEPAPLQWWLVLLFLFPISMWTLSQKE